MKYQVLLKKHISSLLILNVLCSNTLGKSCKCGNCSGKNKNENNSKSSENNENVKNNDEHKDNNNDKLKKEKLKKDQQKANEEKQLKKNKDNLLIKFNELKGNYDKLNKSNRKFFNIDVFTIGITEEEINGSTKDNIGNIETKLDNDINNFNKKLKAQFEVLKNKFNKLKEEDKGKSKDKFDITPIETLINKGENITVNEFIELDNNLNNYKLVLDGNLNGLKKSVKDNYDKELPKLELTAQLDKRFNYDYIKNKIDSIDGLETFADVQNLNSGINAKIIQCDNIIESKEKELTKEINENNEIANKINELLLLKELGIDIKTSDVIFDLNNINDYNNILNKLNELKSKIEEIRKVGLNKFLEKYFIDNLLEKTKWDFVEGFDKYYNYKNLYDPNLIYEEDKNFLKNLEINIEYINNDLDDKIKTAFKEKINDNLYVILEDNKDAEAYLYTCKFYR